MAHKIAIIIHLIIRQFDMIAKVWHEMTLMGKVLIIHLLYETLVELWETGNERKNFILNDKREESKKQCELSSNYNSKVVHLKTKYVTEYI